MINKKCFVFSSLLFVSAMANALPHANTLSSHVQSSSRFVVYWAGWTGSMYDLSKLNSKANVLDLAFANYINGKIDTSASGYLLFEQKGTRPWPSYLNWTRYAAQHPQSKIILSLGGATYGQIWETLANASPDKIKQMAEVIANALNAKYYVYSGPDNDPKKTDKTVALSGIDLDVEAGGARISDNASRAVVQLIKDLKPLIPGKLITFAGFSVGADPVGACTVPGSAHCGEDLYILQNAGQYLDWVNVMAYDAGQDYATSKYKIAMDNYNKLIGKNKTVLGLDLQPQWGLSQPETSQQLADKAAWEKSQGDGGAMLWAVINGSGDPYQYVDAIAEKL